MAEQIKINMKPRSALGGSAPRRLRREGLVPGIVYGGSFPAAPVEVAAAEVGKAGLHENQLVELIVEGKDSGLAIVKQVQVHCLSRSVQHVDFQRISRDEVLVAAVPVVDFGDPVGVVRDGGVLTQMLRELEIRCLPFDLPEKLTVDVSALEIGDSIHAGEIQLPDKVELVTDPAQAVFSVATSRAALAEEEEAKAAAEGAAVEAPAEGAAPAAEKEEAKEES